VEKEFLSYYNDGHIAGNQIKRKMCQSHLLYNEAKASDMKSRSLSSTLRRKESLPAAEPTHV